MIIYPLADYDSFITFRNYGRFLVRKGDIQEGKAFLDRALSVSLINHGPQSFQIAKSYYHLALAYQELEVKDSSRLFFDKSIDTMLADSYDSTISDVSY